MLTIHQTGNWPQHAVRVSPVTSSRRNAPQVEALIESAWRDGQDRLGDRLFDGPMCRMESWRGERDALALELSLTSYRIFLGTNLMNPQLAESLGRDVMANPVGVSTALQTRDGWLMFGRRNATVAYYPNRLHPFAGSIDPADQSDVFAAARRELHEELGIEQEQIESIHCIGLVEDDVIRHPELIFHTRVSLTRSQIESQVQADEHGGSAAIMATRQGIELALGDPQFTPVGIATLLLFGRIGFGDEWLARTAGAMAGVTFGLGAGGIS